MFISVYILCIGFGRFVSIFLLARRLRAKIWPDCAFPDTSMKFGQVVDHD